jgi:hypothetical protein
MASARVNIRTGYIPNTTQTCYPYTKVRKCSADLVLIVHLLKIRIVIFSGLIKIKVNAVHRFCC